MIDKYRDELLKSFLDNYSRVYLIDLEKDTIVKIQESEGAPEIDPVRQSRYSEFNRVYSYTMLESDYSSWREMMGSVENIRKVLAERNSFTLSYQMKDGRWMKVENRILEKRDGVPTKVFACIPKEEKDRLARNEEILEERDKGFLDLINSSERRLREAREKLYKGVLAIDTLSTCEVNVTRNTVIAAIGNNDDIFFQDSVDIPSPFDALVKKWEKRILSDNVNQYRELMTRENLITLYGMGERDLWIECMVQDRFGNKVWLRGIIALSKSDVTGDIMALIIVRDVTERKKIEIENTRRMDLIMGLTGDYESVYFVDLETDSYDIYRRNDRIMTKYSSIFLPSYSESIEAFAYRGVYRQDRENFIHLLSIDQIKKTLEKKNGFTFSFRTGNTGAPQYYRGRSRTGKARGGRKERFPFQYVPRHQDAYERDHRLCQYSLESS